MINGEKGQESDPVCLIEWKLARRLDLSLALLADEMTLGGPVFLTDRGDLMISGLTTCTVTDEHRYPRELSSLPRKCPSSEVVIFSFPKYRFDCIPLCLRTLLDRTSFCVCCWGVGEGCGLNGRNLKKEPLFSLNSKEPHFF